ncbi:HAMP domain-containing protein [Thermodesulfobacteriota bacterium]
MRKRIIISFSLIFALFTFGVGSVVYNLIYTTSNLRKLIDMHEIEDIRQELSLSVQHIQSFSYASARDFSRELDTIIEHAYRVNNSVDMCHSCHHEPAVWKEITQVEEYIAEFQEKLSYMITTVSEGEWHEKNRKQVSELSNLILVRVEAMVNSAAATLQRRTNEAMNSVDRSYNVLIYTLFITFVMAAIIARYLMRGITQPIDALVTATRKVASGDLRSSCDYQATDEFAELIDTFNEMSDSLASKEEKISANLDQLASLNQGSLWLHVSSDPRRIYQAAVSCIEHLMDVDVKGFLSLNEHANRFTFDLVQGADYEQSQRSTIEFDAVIELYKSNFKMPLILDSVPHGGWPFSESMPGITVGNMLVSWMIKDEMIVGALIVINKRSGGFLEEDVDVLGILANNLTIALENSDLYSNLHIQMEELQKTQRQLFEAEKLTALGTLAGGVAHDFNNILCGIIGHIALLKKTRVVIMQYLKWWKKPVFVPPT